MLAKPKAMRSRWTPGRIVPLAAGILVAGLLGLGVALAAQRWLPANATITIRPAETHQTIEAWEATARFWEFNKAENRFDGSWIAWREPILETLLVQGGVNRLRLEIRSGAENPVDYWSQFQAGQIGYHAFKRHFYEKVNDNDDPSRLDPARLHFSELDFRVENIILPAQRIAKAHGRPLSVTLCYVDFKGSDAQGDLSHARHPEEYAELISATYAHLKAKYGLVPDALEVVLEPDNTEGWRGREIGAAMVATAARLKTEGFEAPMIAPSTAAGSLAASYLDDLIAVPGAAPLLSTLSYHRYDGAAADLALPDIVARARRLGAKTAMLEYFPGGIDDLLKDLTRGDASAWQLYAVVSKTPPPPGKSAGVNVMSRFDSAGGASFFLSPQGLDLAQVFHFVEPGAVRLGTSPETGGKAAVAFRNPDGGVVVVVRAAKAGQARVVGLPQGRYGLRVSGAEQPAVTAAADGVRLDLRKGQVATLYRAHLDR